MPHDDDQSYFEHALVKINSGWSKNADRIRNQSCLELTSSNDYFIVSLHLIISNMRPDEIDDSSILIILSPHLCSLFYIYHTNWPKLIFRQTLARQLKFSRYKIKTFFDEVLLNSTVQYSNHFEFEQKSDLKTQKAQTNQ